MFGENYNSDMIRRHYFNRRALAMTFLQTIGAKALVIQSQREHQLHQQSLFSASQDMDESSPQTSLEDSSPPLSEDCLFRDRERDSLTNDVHGMNDEAETRQRIVQKERLRSMRRKLLEKKSVLVYKRGRNQKLRLIELVIQHDRQRETYVVWKSKMNTLKKVEIDPQTLVELLPHQRVDEERLRVKFQQRSLSESGCGGGGGGDDDDESVHSAASSSSSSFANNTQAAVTTPAHLLAQLVRSTTSAGGALPRNDSDASLSSSSTKRLLTGSQKQHSSSSAPPPSRPAHNILTQHLQPLLLDSKHAKYTHDQGGERESSKDRRRNNSSSNKLTRVYSSFHNAKHKPVPFLRLKNKSRALELQFLSHVELEAFLLVLQKYADLEMRLDGSLLLADTALPVESKKLT